MRDRIPNHKGTVGCYSFRKFSETAVYEKSNGNLAFAMKMLNHSDSKVTMNYLKIDVKSVGAALANILGVMHMKRLLLLIWVLLPALVNATQITLVLSYEQETDNAKVCIYENATRTETVTIKPSQQCKYTMTFED